MSNYLLGLIFLNIVIYGVIISVRAADLNETNKEILIELRELNEKSDS